MDSILCPSTFCPGGPFKKLSKRRGCSEMERIRPPFDKLMQRDIHAGETFSHLGENCSIGSSADVGTWAPAERGIVGAEGNL